MFFILWWFRFRKRKVIFVFVVISVPCENTAVSAVSEGDRIVFNCELRIENLIHILIILIWEAFRFAIFSLFAYGVPSVVCVVVPEASKSSTRNLASRHQHEKCTETLRNSPNLKYHIWKNWRFSKNWRFRRNIELSFLPVGGTRTKISIASGLSMFFFKVTKIKVLC